MKIYYLIFGAILLMTWGCSKTKEINIDSKKLLKNVQIFSDDSLEGRAFSKQGNYKTQKFIISKFKEVGIRTIYQNNYLQEFSYTFKG
jgi:hypothetical protein